MMAGRADVGRDYQADMRIVIDKAMRGSEPYNAATLATKMVTDLRHRDPDLLAGWLDGVAETVMRETIGKIDASTRGHARAMSGRRAFATTLNESATDPEVLERWLDARFTVGEEQIRKPLRTMTRPDCVAVAEGYEDRARRNQLQAAFLRAVAKRVTGGRTVGDVFSEAQLGGLWATVSGDQEPPVPQAA